MSAIEKLEVEKESGEKIPKKVFVEVGTNSIPVPFIGNKNFENEIYIGIDLEHENSIDAKKVTKIIGEKHADNVHFINADAESLPISSDSVDELYFGNVFGDPQIKSKILEKFLEEATRVLRVGGKVSIKETNTPAKIEKVVDMLERHGFEMERRLTPSSQDWQDGVRDYDWVSTKKSHRDFFIVWARKKEK